MTNSLWDFGVVGVCHLGPGGGTRLHLASSMTDGLVPPVVIVTRSYGGTSGIRQPRRRSAAPAGHHRPPQPTSSLAGSPSVNDDTRTINITIAGGKTTPSGQKINVRVGQKVILNVTSDTDDEIHAHIGGDGHELPVQAGKPPRGRSPSTVQAGSKRSVTIFECV
jgi:hypothetical protein